MRSVSAAKLTFFMQAEREARLKELASLKGEREELALKLKAFAESDPATYKELKDKASRPELPL